MAAVGESGRESDSDDPYVRLGLSQDATFEQVQAAKARCIAEVDGDDQARARVEAAYDSVLMARLRDRQLGSAYSWSPRPVASLFVPWPASGFS